MVVAATLRTLMLTNAHFCRPSSTSSKAAVRLAAIAAATLLSGCIFFEGPISRKMEKTPNFKQGYSDGCATASTVSANMREQSDVRDRALFRTDKAYRAGWSAGYTSCRPANQRMTMPNTGPIADPYPPR